MGNSLSFFFFFFKSNRFSGAFYMIFSSSFFSDLYRKAAKYARTCFCLNILLLFCIDWLIRWNLAENEKEKNSANDWIREPKSQKKKKKIEIQCKLNATATRNARVFMHDKWVECSSESHFYFSHRLFAFITDAALIFYENFKLIK